MQEPMQEPLQALMPTKFCYLNASAVILVDSAKIFEGHCPIGSMSALKLSEFDPGQYRFWQFIVESFQEIQDACLKFVRRHHHATLRSYVLVKCHVCWRLELGSESDDCSMPNVRDFLPHYDTHYGP